jgi:hypothetical protein
VAKLWRARWPALPGIDLLFDLLFGFLIGVLAASAVIAWLALLSL